MEVDEDGSRVKLNRCILVELDSLRRLQHLGWVVESVDQEKDPSGLCMWRAKKNMP